MIAKVGGSEKNRSRRDPMKVAQYEVLGSLFQAVPVPKGR
jgi:hypothetical protein